MHCGSFIQAKQHFDYPIFALTQVFHKIFETKAEAEADIEQITSAAISSFAEAQRLQKYKDGDTYE